MNQKLILMEGTKDCKYKHEKGSIRISERFLQLRTCLLYTDHCENQCENDLNRAGIIVAIQRMDKLTKFCRKKRLLQLVQTIN